MTIAIYLLRESAEMCCRNVKPKCEINDVQVLVTNSARDKRTVGVAIRITLLFYTEVARRLDRATCVNSPTFVYSKALFKSAFPDFSQILQDCDHARFTFPSQSGGRGHCLREYTFQTVSLSADYL